MPTASFAEGLPSLIATYESAQEAVWGNDLATAREAMRDLRRAYNAMPSTAPPDHPHSQTWSEVRAGIESGLRHALAADDLAALRSAFETVRNHISPLTETDGGDGE